MRRNRNNPRPARVPAHDWNARLVVRCSKRPFYAAARIDYTAAHALVIAPKLVTEEVSMSPLKLAAFVICALTVASMASAGAAAAPAYFAVSQGAHPHDVAAAPGAGAPVYYTAQRTGKLGILDPKTGKFEEIALGARSAPHGVIVGPDGAAWITDGGQNAIVRVDPKTREVKGWALPADTGYANLNTLTFDK